MENGKLAGIEVNSSGEPFLREEVPSPLPAPEQRFSLNLPRKKINARLSTLLSRGFETYYGGLCLIIPFLLQAKVWRFTESLWNNFSHKGIGSLQVFLLLFFAALGGVKTINRLKNIQDIGLAVLAGLPRIPSPAVLHRYLDQVRCRK